MQRGRKPDPVKLHALDGGRAVVPAGGGALVAELPATPAIVLEDALALEEWDRVAPILMRVGLLADLFAGPLAAYCKAFARWVAAEREVADSGPVVLSPNNYPIQNPYLAIANKSQEQMRGWAAEFGMTPTALARAARCADQLNLFDGGDEFDQFMQGGSRG